MGAKDHFFKNTHDLFNYLNSAQVDPLQFLAGIAAGRPDGDEDPTVRMLRMAYLHAQAEGASVEKLWADIEARMGQRGYQIAIREESSRAANEFKIYFVPKHVPTANTPGDLAAMKKWSSISFSGVDPTGLVARYGQKAFNQGRLGYDFVKHQLAFYTSQEHAAHAILRRLVNNQDIFGAAHGQGGTNTRFSAYAKIAASTSVDPQLQKLAQSHVRGSITNAEREANGSYIASTGYQNRVNQAATSVFETMQGLSTARARAIRRSIVNVNDIISSIMGQVSEAARQSYQRAHPYANDSKQVLEERISDDLMKIITRYFQNRPLQDIEKDLGEAAFSGGWSGSYLWNNAAVRQAIKEAGAQLHQLGADIGLTSEEALARREVSLLRHGDLAPHGSLGDKAGRKQIQTAQARGRTKFGMRNLNALLKKNTKVITKQLFTGWEIANELNTEAEDLAQYSFMFATEEEIAKARDALIEQAITDEKNKRQAAGKTVLTPAEETALRSTLAQKYGAGRGAREGSIWISGTPDIVRSLASQQERSATFSNATFQKYLGQLTTKLVGADSDKRQRIIHNLHKYALTKENRTALQKFAASFNPATATGNFLEELQQQNPQLHEAVTAALRHEAALQALRQENQVDISTILGSISTPRMIDPNGETKWVVNWLEKHGLRSGEKVVGREGHLIKGRAEVIEGLDALMTQIYKGRGLSDAEAARASRGISMLMEPEKLTARNVDAFLDTFIHGALGQMSGVKLNPGTDKETDLTSLFIAGINRFQDGKPWISLENGQYKINYDRFANKLGMANEEALQDEVIGYVQQLQNVLSDLSQKVVAQASATVDKAAAEGLQNTGRILKNLSEAIYIDDKKKRDENGNLILDLDEFGKPQKILNYDPNKFIGSTGLGQAYEFDYGKPGRAVLRADYRFIEALDNEMIAAALASGTSVADYSKAVLGQRVVDDSAKSRSEYPWQLKLDKAGVPIHAGLFGGDKHAQDSVDRWRKGKEAVADALNWLQTEGRTWTLNKSTSSRAWGYNIPPGTPYGSKYDLILGTGTFEQFLQSFGLSSSNNPSVANDLRERYIDISGLNQDEFLTDSDYLNNHRLMDDAAKNTWKLIQTKQQQLAEQRAKDLKDYGADSVGAPGRTLFVPASKSFVASYGKKQINATAIAVPTIDELGGLNEQEILDENSNLVQVYDLPEVYNQLNALIRAQHAAVVTDTLSDEQKHRFGWTTTPARATAELNDAMMNFITGMYDLYNSKEGSEFDAANHTPLYHSMWGKATASAVKPTREGWSQFLNDTATRISEADLTLLLNKQDSDMTSEDFLARLKWQYHYLWDNLLDHGFEEAEQALDVLLKDQSV